MPDANSVSLPLGSWLPSELEKTARADAGVGTDEGLPPTVRFKSNVAKLIRRRRALSSSDPPHIAVFLLYPVPPDAMSPRLKPRVPMLGNGLTSVTGRVWFVNATAATGRYVEADEYGARDDEQLFQLVTDVVGLGSTPAIIYDPRLPTPEARFYEKGLGDAENYSLVTFEDEDISLNRIFEVIGNVHTYCLITPDAQTQGGKLWLKPARWWPAPTAEAIVQLNLKAGLVGAFPTCTVRHEQPMPEGRLDLEIEQNDPIDRSKITRHALLELKVLRSFHHTGTPVPDEDTERWIESGVSQAAAYRDSKGARASALCCFDMRKENSGDSCFDRVRDRAIGLSVELRRWFLYATAKHYREAMSGSASSARG